MLDPTQQCGVAECIRVPEIYENYYPEWANPLDVEVAEIDGKFKRE